MSANRLQDRFHQAMSDVSKMFDRPRALFEDPEFDADQKRRLLMQWEYDLREMLVATEENMPAPEGKNAGNGGELLREVRLFLRQLGDKRPDRSAAHKQGG